jgi:hypothetical protein
MPPLLSRCKRSKNDPRDMKRHVARVVGSGLVRTLQSSGSGGPKEPRDPLKLARYYQSLLEYGQFESRAAPRTVAGSVCDLSLTETYLAGKLTS